MHGDRRGEVRGKATYGSVHEISVSPDRDSVGCRKSSGAPRGAAVAGTARATRAAEAQRLRKGCLLVEVVLSPSRTSRRYDGERRCPKAGSDMGAATPHA